MERSAFDWQELAWRLLAHEARDRETLAGLAEAADAIWGKLHERLEELIGAMGSQAVAARALRQVVPRFGFLACVEVEVQSSLRLVGLRECTREASPEEVGRSLAAWLGDFLELMCSLIGEWLTAGLVRRIWPEVPLEGGAGQEEGQR